ncbi:DNA primase [Candidatus Microgenomates bacterium]|nr:MAG: DNA primase [Candidatus Microgenomates bacterium]
MDELKQIKDRISIVDLISESVNLKKAGRNFKGLCPFHNEKSPSFVVSPERQIWHCFGCGKGGDIFTYLMELDRMEFPQALEILAKRAGVTLSKRPHKSQEQHTRDKLIELHHLTREFYQYVLLSHRVGELARKYLAHRGVTEKLIKTFGLGFAPQQWDSLAKFLLKKKYDQQLLLTSGLVLRGNRGLYDRFRSRIMFPITTHRDETIAFSGRILVPSDREAKYINSPETPIYTKGDTLYGLSITKDAIRKSGQAVIMEGEFDVISSFRVGVTNVVAIKGSALTQAQARLIKRFSEEIVLALDQDSAGIEAAKRGIAVAESQGLEIKVAADLHGKDPDEVAKTHPEILKEALKKNMPYYDFLIANAFASHNPQEAYGKKKITDEVLPWLAHIENVVVQSHYLTLLSQKLGMSEEKLSDLMQRKNKQTKLFVAQPQQTAQVKQQSPEEVIEEHLLALVLQSPDVSGAVTQVGERVDPSDMRHPVIKQIFMALIDAISTVPFDIKAFASTLPAEILPTLDRLYLQEIEVQSDSELFTKELEHVIFAVKKYIVRRKIDETSAKLAQAQNAEQVEVVQTLQQEMEKYTHELKLL